MASIGNSDAQAAKAANLKDSGRVAKILGLELAIGAAASLWLGFESGKDAALVGGLATVITLIVTTALLAPPVLRKNSSRLDDAYPSLIRN